jgi:hypothetical protein
MDPAAILAETPGNWSIDNGAIGEIKLHIHNLNRGNHAHAHEFIVEIQSMQGKYQFNMEEHNEFPELLKRVYGERVKMPFGYYSGHGVRVKLF